MARSCDVGWGWQMRNSFAEDSVEENLIGFGESVGSRDLSGETRTASSSSWHGTNHFTLVSALSRSCNSATRVWPCEAAPRVYITVRGWATSGTHVHLAVHLCCCLPRISRMNLRMQVWIIPKFQRTDWADPLGPICMSEWRILGK